MSQVSKAASNKPEINHKKLKKEFDLAKSLKPYGVEKESILFRIIHTMKEDLGWFKTDMKIETGTELFNHNQKDCKGPFPGPSG